LSLPHFLIIGFLMLALSIAGCRGIFGSGASDTNISNEQTSDEQTTQTIQIELLPPDQQEGGSLAVRVQDAAGEPIMDASVRLEGDMNHAGMIPVISEPVEHASEGIYRVPFEFTMLGDWIITAYVTTADGREHTEVIEIGVRRDGLVMP
jgi:hypothetical protein